MNVLVMNLTRLGDLLQSQPAVAGLTAMGHRVALACLENFAPAARLMQGVEAVFPLPGARLLSRLDADWRAALATHHDYVAAVRKDFRPDIVINLTPSGPARLLARGMGAAEVRGFAMDEFGFNADTSLWAAFLQLASTERGASPFNVVDMFRRICGLAGAPRGFGLRGPTGDERAAARARMLELLPAPPPKGFAALQLGASEDRRRWPVEHFAHVARGLSRAGYAPVLVGTASERHLGERLRALAGVPVADLMGATGLVELAAALTNCGVLVTNDTGTMHLAAGLGVPCAALFLATAQPWDTGPYLPGCVSLEPDQPCHPCAFGVSCREGNSCRARIEPGGVLALALGLLAGRVADAVAIPGARVWRTVIGADGLLDLESLSGHGDGDRARFIRLQRRLYRRYLDGEPLAQEPPCPAGLSPALAAELAGPISQALELLFLLRRQGELLAQNPLPAMKTKFLANWQRVRGCLEANGRLAPLAALWIFEAERPGLDITGILSLAERFAALLKRLHGDISIGT